jgi:hypothetical protein
MDEPFNPDENAIEWNINGTNEYEYVNTEITAVVYENGDMTTDDPVVGRKIIGNLKRPIAKIVDISRDVPSHSTVFGMNLGVQWSNDSDNLAFYGKSSRMILAGFSWQRMKCYNSDNHGTELYQDDFPWASQNTAIISDIEWGNLGDSLAMTQLKEAASDGKLQMRITTFYHTQNYPPYVARNATLGYILGVIGVANASDTENVPGERAMFFKNQPLGLTANEDENDLCYNQSNLTDFGKWTNFAPFEVDQEKFEVRFDLSNSIPTNLSNTLRSIGTLRLGVLLESCVLLLGEESDQGIPYASTIELPKTNAIYSVPVDRLLMGELANNPIVVVQILQSGVGKDNLCTQHIGGEEHSINIILQEYPYFVRPKGYYTIFLDRNYNSTGTQTVYATRYGRAMKGIQLNVVQKKPLNGPPEKGVVPVTLSTFTDENGLATFEFKLEENIPVLRHYMKPPCKNSPYPDDNRTLPIDGQVYFFYYCPVDANISCEKYNYVQSFTLAFSDMNYTRPYTWVKDVGPILSQYARLAPTMGNIMDLSSYYNVTKLNNLNLLNLTLRLDIDDPSYMPTTRDLSPTKRAMILEWIKRPIYDTSSSKPVEQAIICRPPTTSAVRHPEYFCPDRCMTDQLRVDVHPHDYEPYFRKIVGNTTGLGNGSIPGRPLAGNNSCSYENVTEQLQTAIELEWATIPVYLTSLYSIAEGCNTEIYDLIHSVIMQEMLHFTQSANILIAMGGSPLIDNASVTPEFPVTGLPGNVLTKLYVNLEKFSLQHVYNVFMGIEIPNATLVGIPVYNHKHTIGVFYDEISDCIEELGDRVFDPSSLSRQVKWPWKPSKYQGDVIPVNDSLSAQNGIKMIVSQGEGAGLLDPTEMKGDGDPLAHYFKFEEIVCQKHLVQEESGLFYSYSGAPIPYESAGVWPMRPNPKACTVPPNTNCYTESRAFHQVYRMLLRKLQDVFSGKPEDIFVAVQLMESLQLHAKKLMWTKFNPYDLTDDTTCGPVWDYDWPEKYMDCGN